MHISFKPWRCISLTVVLVAMAGCSANYKAGSDSSAVSSAIATDSSSVSEFNTESYDHIVENEFIDSRQQPLSTFSIDVDTASYANVRRFLHQNTLPPAGAVRIEELINYFPYSYEPPENDEPFAVHVDAASCPWQREHHLVRIALKGKEIDLTERKPCNLVFLLDVSGSMSAPDKLPLVKSALHLLLTELDQQDRIGIVVYAGQSGLALPSTSVDDRIVIADALDSLQASGSTNGAEGIQLAYQIAQDNFIPDGVNRVILCTDGDFNVGVTNQSELVDLIKTKAQTGVFLSVFGFGQGNLNDSTMEKLADNGNGNYGYIDSLLEAKKNLVEQMGGTLYTIAKDVKIQVDFNPVKISSYRLIGYENRMLQASDFKDDTKDAGEIGAGHTVTALYQVVPSISESVAREVDPSKYVDTVSRDSNVAMNEWLTVRLRYKLPDEEQSRALDFPLTVDNDQLAEASTDFQFASAVAAFGMLLRQSKHAGDANFDWIVQTASNSRGEDLQGYRSEFVQLAETAKALTAQRQTGQHTSSSGIALFTPYLCSAVHSHRFTPRNCNR